MRYLATICLSLLASPAYATDTNIEAWVAAAGGRDKLSSVRAIYREATIEVAGYTGTIKVWRTPDGKYRKEEQIGPLVLVETFDGAVGMMQRGQNSPQMMNEAELARARSAAFANFAAVFFVAFPEHRRGTVVTEADGTIVLRPEGGIDWRVTLSPDLLLPHTMVHQEGDRTVTVTFFKVETIDGITMEKQIRRLTGDPNRDSVIWFTKTVINPAIDVSLFSIKPESAAVH